MAIHANRLTNLAPQVSAGGATYLRAYQQYCSLLNAIHASGHFAMLAGGR
jgi:hypothetical protein